MLGARTKQVYTYGKRAQRIVNVSDNRDETETKVSTSPARALSDSSSVASSGAEVTSRSTRRIKPKPKVPQSPFSSPRSVKKTSRKKAIVKVDGSPVLAKAKLTADSPARKPLSAVSANAQPTRRTVTGIKTHMKPKSVVPSKPAQPRAPSYSLKPISHLVNVDITVLDDRGKSVKQEQRVSRNDVQMNPNQEQSKPSPSEPAKTKASGKSVSDAIVLSDDDYEEDLAQPRRAKKPVKPTRPAASRARAIVLSSDEESEVDVPIATAKPPLRPSSPDNPALRRRTSVKNRAEIVLSPSDEPDEPIRSVRQPALPPKIPAPAQLIVPPKHNPLPRPYRNAIHFSPLVHAKVRRDSRPLTPYRSKPHHMGFPAPPSPPSPATDVDEDLSFDFSQIALSPGTLHTITGKHGSFAAEPEKLPPAWMAPLLEACSQTSPHEFSAFIEMFPFDPIVQTSHGGVGLQPRTNGKSSKTKAYFQKIGEASYSEVFGIGDVVLKVIPLRDEEAGNVVLDNADTPAPSDAKDVVKEIIVTRAMGNLCEGFVQLLRTYVVRGKYPSVLLDLWDEYDERKGSEGIRPEGFGVSQLYAIIVLPNGGPDLEAFAFSAGSKNVWRQATSLFWQVARTLAEAEDLVQFEHRDLHWGQILVKAIADVPPARIAHGRKVPMDHDIHGVKATVIDLGLSRMVADEADGVHFTVPDQEVFEGEGEYQFDIYRMMKAHNGHSWRAYRPLTNVMWLHYLIDKLLHSKRLRAPIAPRKTPVVPSTTFTERECWQCLVDVELLLRDAVASCKAATKKGRRKTQAVMSANTAGGLSSASDVLELGIGKGWVN